MNATADGSFKFPPTAFFPSSPISAVNTQVCDEQSETIGFDINARRAVNGAKVGTATRNAVAFCAGARSAILDQRLKRRAAGCALAGLKGLCVKCPSHTGWSYDGVSQFSAVIKEPLLPQSDQYPASRRCRTALRAH